MTASVRTGFDVTKQRYGNLFLDIFAFHRKTLESGWNFRRSSSSIANGRLQTLVE